MNPSENPASSLRDKTGNQINVIFPYLWNGIWVFDDPDVGLVKEALIAGIPEIITTFIGDATSFKAIISHSPFPGADGVLKKFDEIDGGGLYNLEGTDLNGWLCPALLKYFPNIPLTIYFKIEL